MAENWSSQVPRYNVHKVVVLGSSGGGKSALILRFITDEFLLTSDTPKAEHYEKKVIMAGEEVFINILDTPDKKVPISVRNTWYTVGEGFLVVFSILDEESFVTAQELRKDIVRHKADWETPIILIGNKCDMEGGRKISRKDATKMANKWNIEYLETSARTGKNVRKAFLDMARSIEAKKEVRAENADSRPCCEIL